MSAKQKTKKEKTSCGRACLNPSTRKTEVGGLFFEKRLGQHRYCPKRREKEIKGWRRKREERGLRKEEERKGRRREGGKKRREEGRKEEKREEGREEERKGKTEGGSRKEVNDFTLQ